MSFVAKAVKKVFKKVKKVVKRLWDNKWVRTALLIGATVFTAGLAAGGWTFAAGQGIGGFFASVGNTFAAGFNSIVSGVKGFFGAGKGATDATLIGQAATTDVASKATGTLIAESAAASPFGTTIVGEGIKHTGVNLLGQTAASTAGTTGNILTKAGGWLFGPGKGAAFARTALAQGAMSYLERKDYEERRANVTIAGGRAFGDKDSAYRGPLSFETGAGNAAGERARQGLFQPTSNNPEEFAARSRDRSGDLGARGFASYAPNYENANATQIAPRSQGLARAGGG